MAKEIKTDRVLELFYRATKGEELSAQKLAEEYGVSPRSISRDITNLKNFLADHQETLGYAELVYNGSNHCYHLEMDNFISNKELLAVTKVLIGARAFSQQELLTILGKLKLHTTTDDRHLLDELIRKEVYQYDEINYDCESVIETVWALAKHIDDQRAVTIHYIRSDRKQMVHKIKPLSLMFTEYYFYLIAYKYEDDTDRPTYFRVDRIVHMTAHREHFKLKRDQTFDEGLLRRRSQFMWPGKLRTIRFEYYGPSVQAILDRLPTARIIDITNGVITLEAEVYGDGIKMFLLSQGHWVKVISPQDFVDELRAEVEQIAASYREDTQK